MNHASPSIAIVGMACIYPDARTPGELWENVLAQRRAFRRLPAERLRAEDYFSADPKSPDCTYAIQGAVIEGYEFDRVAYRIVGSTFRAADLSHWLALDVAAKALADAGFSEGSGLPRESTGVLLGNTLTGEFSRANLLRLRWPYVRRVLDAALTKEMESADSRVQSPESRVGDAGRGTRDSGLGTPASRRQFLDRLEVDYKSPFPTVGEETLAGGLSNTIAGRICNQFDLKGGGYTVDGACASSLLAVANACSSLAGGDLDVALAGGVDLSLDPFEIVGFAKTGALAADEMRVFDRRSAGFWPGEGCGFVVLMRHEDAVAQARRIYAVIRGWGISSDGSGGITRPEAEGQLEALRRAYRRAGFGADSVTYCEGHGTGTAVGDETELEVLSRARREAKPDAPPAVVGSVKANIGHTKAAAGLAGLIKATMAVHTQVLPPISGCEQPHEQFGGPSPALRVLRQAEVWPNDRALRASVSAMGFGGINAHIVLESVVAERRNVLSAREQSLSDSHQDGELFLLAAESVSELAAFVDKLVALAAHISLAELTDLAAQLQKTLVALPVRGAVVASKPAELVARLQTLRFWLEAGGPSAEGRGQRSEVRGQKSEANCRTSDLRPLTSDLWPPPRLLMAEGVFLGSGETPPRLGFLFPGQGSPTHLDGGAWCHRFDSVRELYARVGLAAEADTISTRVMQPAVVTASLAGLKVLNDFGLTANAAIGHSLGEITALHWAGAFNEEALLRIAQVRGAAMAELGSPTGAMVALAAPWQKVHALLDHEPLTIVGFNSPCQTVVAGEVVAIARLEQRAAAQGWLASRLPVSHAFHTPLVSAAVPVLAEQLARESFTHLRRTVVSTITAGTLESDADLRALLCRQVTSPVRFESALAALLGGPERKCESDQVGRSEGRNHPLNGSPTCTPDQPAPLAVDLLIEVGPGAVLSNLVREGTEVPVVALDAGGPSLKGLLRVIGAAFAAGVPVKHAALFADRFARPFALDQKPKFFANPCELAPVPEAGREEAEVGSQKSEVRSQIPDLRPLISDLRPPTSDFQPPASDLRSPAAPLDLVRQLVAARAELPVASIRDENRMLSDLHLNSITVGQLVSEAAKQLGLPRLVGVTEFANASVAEMAQALEELQRTGGKGRGEDPRRAPAGVDTWIRSFVVEWVEARRPQHRRAGRPRPQGDQSHWSVEEVRALGSDRSAANRDDSRSEDGWLMFAPRGHPLAASLLGKLNAAGGGGVVVCLPEKPTAEHLGLLLAGARAVLDLSGEIYTANPIPPAGPGSSRGTTKARRRFVLVQHGWGGAGFARTLHLETPGLTTCVVNVPPTHRSAADWVVGEAFSAAGYTEAHYDDDGRRWEPRLKLNPAFSSFSSASLASSSGFENESGTTEEEEGGFPIGSKDVLLVTGGGKGIAAECALALGRRTGASLAILCRSNPDTDKALAANLARFAAAGVRCCHVSADVTDAAAVRAAVTVAEQQLGPVTGLLHGAGTNEPQLISALDEAAFHRTLAPKIQGAHNVLAALDAQRLRLFVTFGSIIARIGLRGEADYATANEWLTALTEEFHVEHPRCRCLALEWSVWSGVGMGERLGRIETLTQQGITPIPVEEGVRILLELLSRPQPAVAVVVAGRFGEPATLKMTEAELPLRRFLDRKRLYYPGVELIVDAELSTENDPYLNDHVLQKQKLLPAVLGLEAMAQAAMALTGSTLPPRFENVQLARPVSVSDRPTIIRLAALRRAPDLVEVCLRSEETDFQVDHFRAFCRTGRAGESDTSRLSLSPARRDCLSLDPHKDLYGRLLFHEGRFCRLRCYQLLKARECVAEIAPAGAQKAEVRSQWFGPYLPAEFVLGDPAARDATIHAIQACIPHRRILPTGIDELVILRAEPGASQDPTSDGTSGPAGPGSSRGARFVRARQRMRDGNNFTYDLEVTDASGSVVERWTGLHLRAVEEMAAREAWPEALLAPYLERRLEELAGHANLAVALERGMKERRQGTSDEVIQQALGRTERIWRRPDGKPVMLEPGGISAAHCRDLTLAVAGPGGVACDLEEVTALSAPAWRGLLGEERFKLAERIARERGEGTDTAATRLWTASECLRKVGLPGGAPLVLESMTPDGWVMLRSGALSIATCAVSVAGNEASLVAVVAFKTEAVAEHSRSGVAGD